MANGYLGYKAGTLPDMFGSPGQALQNTIRYKEGQAERQYEIDYRNRKEQEAEDWRKLNLINDLTDLQTMEAQNKYQALGNLNSAYEGMVNEGDKEYQSMLEKYKYDVAQKNALYQSGMENKYGAVGDLSSLGIQLSRLS